MAEIAIAYDVETLDRALALDDCLGAGPEYAKIGLQLYTREGPPAVRVLTQRGRRIFLDLKLHDIPNTVKGSAAAVGSLGADLLTVHAQGGEAMIAAAVEGIAMAGARTRVVAVTWLTSLDPNHPPPGAPPGSVWPEVAAAMLSMAERAGAAGIVCAARDLPSIRERHPESFFAVTPAIRPAGASRQDQARVATIGEAVRLGSGMVVLGRAITGASDPRAALERARAECRVRLDPGEGNGR